MLSDPHCPLSPLSLEQKIISADDLDMIRDLEKIWARLRSNSDLYLPMQDYNWQLSCAEIFRNQSPLKVLVDNVKVNSIAIFSRKNSLLGGYELLGVNHTHEPSDFIYHSNDTLIALANRLLGIDECIILGRIRNDSPTIHTLKKVFKYKGIVIEHETGCCPFIEINKDISTANQILSKRLVEDIRRARRKAESFGKVKFEICSPKSENEFVSLYEKLVALEDSGWKGNAGTAIKQNPLQMEFYCQYGIRATRNGSARMVIMYIDDAIVAMQYAIEWGHKFWLLKIAHDEKYGKCSPGMLLIQESLEYAIKNKLKSYEFLGGSEEWIKRWTKTEWGTVRVEIYPYKVKAMFALVIKIINYSVNKAKLTFKF